jgi:hypothetical protein
MKKKMAWIQVATRDVKYDTFTLDELLSWIKEKVPEGTRNEDIEIKFDVSESPTYYDEIIVDVEMQISVKE